MDTILNHGDRLELTIDSGTDTTMAFRWIPPCPEGFLMGDRLEKNSQPVHRVIISRGFWLGETLVTQAQFGAWTAKEEYSAWLEENEEKIYGGEHPHKNEFEGDPQTMPADSISFYEARAFCEWLNERQIPVGEGQASLPTEVQWEYACRAGTTTEYHNGDGIAAMREAGWSDENSDKKTKPVRQKKRNVFGLFDMHGNLWEWCVDALQGDAYWIRRNSAADHVAVSGEAETMNSGRVLRGGSWFNSASFCRSAFRYWINAGGRDWNFGFRVGLFPGPGGQPDNNRR